MLVAVRYGWLVPHTYLNLKMWLTLTDYLNPHCHPQIIRPLDQNRSYAEDVESILVCYQSAQSCCMGCFRWLCDLSVRLFQVTICQRWSLNTACILYDEWEYWPSLMKPLRPWVTQSKPVSSLLRTEMKFEPSSSWAVRWYRWSFTC